jgi:hypothetical protein
MRTHWLLTGAVVGAVSMGGLMPAAVAGPSAHHHARTTAAGGHHIEHFNLTTTNRKGNSSVLATGYFTAGGAGHIRAKGELLDFGRGTVRFHDVISNLKGEIHSQTCYYTSTFTVKYKLRHGKGTYAHVTGHGTGHGVEHAVLGRTRKGVCSLAVKPRAYQSTIWAKGTVSHRPRH